MNKKNIFIFFCIFLLSIYFVFKYGNNKNKNGNGIIKNKINKKEEINEIDTSYLPLIIIVIAIIDFFYLNYSDCNLNLAFPFNFYNKLIIKSYYFNKKSEEISKKKEIEDFITEQLNKDQKYIHYYDENDEPHQINQYIIKNNNLEYWYKKIDQYIENNEKFGVLIFTFLIALFFTFFLIFLIILIFLIALNIYFLKLDKFKKIWKWKYIITYPFLIFKQGNILNKIEILISFLYFFILNFIFSIKNYDKIKEELKISICQKNMINKLEDTLDFE